MRLSYFTLHLFGLTTAPDKGVNLAAKHPVAAATFDTQREGRINIDHRAPRPKQNTVTTNPRKILTR